MFKGSNGLPNPSTISTFVSAAAGPIDLKIGPDGNLYYVDFNGGTVRRIQYTGSTSTLPSPWGSQDVGGVAAAGSASYANGTFTVKASGADIWGTADEFHYVYQPLSGNGVITARVASLTNTHSWAKAGVMIRETLNANAKHAATLITPGQGVSFQRRTSTGGTSATTTLASVTIPEWVRLERNGTTFTAWHSENGTSWTQMGSVTISMGTSVYVGLAVTSHNDGVLTTATVDNVGLSTSLAPTPTISSPASSLTWKVGDTITFSGSATDAEDGPLSAAALTWSIIMRHCPSSCHTHDIQTFTGISSGSFVAPDHEYPSSLEIKLTARDSSGTESAKSVIVNPKTVNLTLSSSPSGLGLGLNGTTATAPVTKTVIVNSQNSINAPTPQTLGGTTYVFSSWSDGGAASHNISAPASATTYTATFTPQTGGTLPSPWGSQDVGGVAAVGSASYANGTFTVNASGADIWGTADEFHYVYQQLSGNGVITARVASLTNTNSWAKAGVMIRETLNANAKHAATLITPGQGVTFQRRTSTGGTSATTTLASVTIPEWVRLERNGTTFTAWHSENGTSWTQIGSVTISMGTSVYVGLAVTSHNDGVLTTATVDNVGLSTSLAPTPTISAPASSLTWKVGDTITFSGSAPTRKMAP